MPLASRFATSTERSGFTAVRVTAAAYEKRRAQIENFIANNLPADIIAFQEVAAWNKRALSRGRWLLELIKGVPSEVQGHG